MAVVEMLKSLVALFGGICFVVKRPWMVVMLQGSCCNVLQVVPARPHSLALSLSLDYLEAGRYGSANEFTKLRKRQIIKRALFGRCIYQFAYCMRTAGVGVGC